MESTLAIDLFKLQAEVGDFAGFGRGARYGDTAWDTVQQTQIDVSVETGLRLVYHTMPFQDIPAAYDWSFLSPRSQLILGSGENEIALPDDFGGIRGEFIPVASGETVVCRVPIVDGHALYASRTQGGTQTGRPRLAYVEWIKGTSPTKGQRAKLSIFPTSDQAYTLSVWYDLLPDAPSTSLPHVYGGAAHAETFIAACRAAFEWKYSNKQDIEWARFIERLRASIQYDRKFKPLYIGRNLDTSDETYRGRPVGTIHFDYMGITPG